MSERTFEATLAGTSRVHTLDNGLTLCLAENRQAALVTTALWYRVGARHEEPAEGGIAHFLEHMMFKGSSRYGPGEVDRLTEARGGSNNAFTSHDATVYYFQFAADRWQEALAIESDRMRDLTLDPREVDSERRVILEEIAMYHNEPWDALEMEVLRELFPSHPYGRPVLGSTESVHGLGAGELRRFHRRFYDPSNAVLVVAGDVDEDAMSVVERTFAGVESRHPAAASEPPPDPSPPAGRRTLERRQGEIARLLVALPVPPASHADHPRLRLLLNVLTGGRSSRLHRRLVEEEQLCVWLSGDLSESVLGGSLVLAAELLPGAEPAPVLEALESELRAVVDGRIGEGELERAKQIAVADWVFGHERIHQQGLALGFALSLFDLDHPRRYYRSLLATDREELHETAGTYLRPQERGVVGWSLPE